MNFTVACDCGCPGAILTYTNVDLAAMKQAIANGQITNAGCAHCGCDYNPTDAGATIGRADVSRPKIISLSTSSGPPAGGMRVELTGHALSVGNVVVRFDGAPCAPSVATDDEHLTVLLPVAPYTRVRTQGRPTGALVPGDRVVGNLSGKAGTIHGFGSGQVRLVGLNGALTPGEFLEKGANKLQIAARAIYAPCDVTVANEHGWRATGGGLAGAFTYQP